MGDLVAPIVWEPGSHRARPDRGVEISHLYVVLPEVFPMRLRMSHRPRNRCRKLGMNLFP